MTWTQHDKPGMPADSGWRISSACSSRAAVQIVDSGRFPASSWRSFPSAWRHYAHRAGAVLRRCAIHVVAWGLLCVGCWPAPARAQVAADAASATKPNIVVILADDLGWGDVRAMRPESTLPTPRIDSIAAAGMRFTDAHSPSSVCTPTRYGLLTGRYGWRTPLTEGTLRGYSPPLIEPDRPTLGTLLQARGYRTAAIGKWHLGMAMPRLPEGELQASAGNPGIDFGGVISDSPVDHGFDEFFGLSGSPSSPPYVYIRDDRFTAIPVRVQPGTPGPHLDIKEGPLADDFVFEEVQNRLVEEAVAFVDRASQAEQPFFLYLPLTAPHVPILPDGRFLGTTGLGRYGDFVAQLDDAVGQVLSALEEAGVLDDTLLVFTSDNGSYMEVVSNDSKDHTGHPSRLWYRENTHRANGPWRGRKKEIFEGGHRVPLLVRWPGVVAAGSETAATVTLTDLYATLADIVGEEALPGVAQDSVSLLPILRGASQTRGVPVVHSSSSGMVAVRDGPWKLVLGNGTGGPPWLDSSGIPFERPWRLYDLSRDPAEADDIFYNNLDVAARLVAVYESIVRADSHDATLSALSLSGIDIGAFSGDTTAYAASVAHVISSTTVTAAARHAAASVSISPGNEVSLAVGANEIAVTATAEDGFTTKTYTVTVTRAAAPLSEDATLRTLSLSGVDIGAFSADSTVYAASVAHEVASTTVTATASHSAAKVTIEPGSEVSLAVGANEIAVTATAEDGFTTKTYTVTVTRAAAPLSEDATLRTLSLSGVDIGAFSADSTAYAASVAHEVASTTVTATASHSAAKVTIEPGSEVNLAVGENAIAVTVTAEDGSTTRTYTVTVTRAEEPALPVVSIAAVEERLVGPIGEFRVSRTGPTAEALQVQVLFSNSRSPRTRTLTMRLLPGRSSVTRRVQAGDNRLVEDDITVTYTLREGEGYTVSAEQGSASVVLEESDIPEFSVSVQPAEIAEGESAAVRVAIANGVRFREAQTIDLSVSGTASGSDYRGVPQTLRLRAYKTSTTTRLTAAVDGEEEAEETVTITASHGGTEIGSATVTIAGAATPLTGRLVEMPEAHDGETAFAFELRFSEEIRISYKTLRDTAFEVRDGVVRGARRLERPSNRRWEITVEPTSDGDMELVLPVTTDCAAEGAVCTAAGKRLSERLTATVPGPGTQASVQGFSLAPDNGRPSGIWSDGATAWVADLDDGKLYAYRLSDGERAPERDVAVGGSPMGLWSDGATLWVAELSGGLAGYRLSDGERLAGRDLALPVSASPVGVWSDGATVWISEWLGDTVHAYRLSDGERAPARDIRLAAGNLLPVGLWSDGETLWVADWDERIVAYRLSDGERAPERDVAAEGSDADPSGLWSDGETLLVTGWEGGEVRAYALPAATAATAAAVRVGGGGGWAAGVPGIGDAALRAAIAAAGAEGLAELEVLDARHGGIRSLAGLEGAVNLKELDLGFNPLDDTEALGKLPSLRSLNLDGAAPDLSALWSLTGLERLSLRHNGVSDLSPLAGLSQLRELDVGDNRIEDLSPLAGLAGLTALRADRNRIVDLWPLASLPRLAVVDLGRNRIRDLQALAGLGGLRRLLLDGNGLSEPAPLAGLAGLRELGLAGNAVKDLGALSGLAGLRRLDLRGNPVRDLSPLWGLRSLGWVHVGASGIDNLSPLDGAPELRLAGVDDRETPHQGGYRTQAK